jgi:hypothetical protein
MAAYHSSERRELPHNRTISQLHKTIEPQPARCELDSHADTCALGANFTPLSYTGRVCDVSPYNADAYSPERNIPIVSAATAFTCQESGLTYILIINEGLWFGNKLSNSLINPNQLRFVGVLVQDNPFAAHPLAIETNDINIPLLLTGTTIYFDSTTPTQHELDTCPHIHLTSDTEWNPHNVRLSAAHSVEAEMVGGGIFDELEPGLAQISAIFQRFIHFAKWRKRYNNSV